MSAARTVLLNVALLLVYFAAGKFGLAYFGLIHPSASPVWLPTGVALAALLLLGPRVAPAIFVGAFLVNVTTAGSIPTSLGVAAGNTLEGVVGTWLVERFAGGSAAFTSAARLLKFAVLAAGVSTAISATIGVTSLSLGGYARPEDWGEIWFTWWLGDAAGAVLVTPLLVLWSTNGERFRELRSATPLLLATGTIGAAVFFHPALGRYPLAFLCLAPLVWGALRFGPRELATAVALLATIAITATATGRGSFTMPTPNESLLALQAFLVLIALTALPMSALTVERRVLLERERAARAEADAASRAKDEFVALVSHELRNPLAAISAAGAALDAGVGAPSDTKRLIGSIRRQSQHLARLIDDLLDIGRTTGQKLSLRTEPLELDQVVRRAVENFLAARGLAPQRIELALTPVWIDADSGRIVQIVENLVDNALKHTPATRRIRVTVAAVGDCAELRVEDEGRGIEPELLPRVFEPFTQGAQGLDRSAGGLGLGLTLVRRLTELHGGTVAARSGGENGGSGFTLSFPRLAGATRPSGAGEPRPDPQAARPCRILVIEDNEDARLTLRAFLEALGHEVHDASDGESGVAAASALDPDIVFVDIGLPRVDGYEVARRLRNEGGARPRLVALTGYGREADVRRAREAGFDEHLLKPAGADRLQAVLAGLLPERPT